MAKKVAEIVLALLLISTISVGADWNILNQKWSKERLDSESLKNYCESWRINVELNNIRGFEVVPQECVGFIKKYMTSSQYKADSWRAVEEVTLFLSTFGSLKGDGFDAWIFDIDDTLLSTVPYFNKHGFGGEKMNKTSLEAWMKKKKGPALEPAMKIFNEIRERGIKIFLISSRKETLRSSTVDNLIHVGYHGWTGLILRSFDDELMEVHKYKSLARKRLVEDGYRILGIVGISGVVLREFPLQNEASNYPIPSTM